MRTPTHQGRERGAAAVEMAFVTILLALLACGVADLGRAIFTNIGVQDAAQEGARFAAYNPPDGDITAIQDRAVQATQYPNLTRSDVTVTCAGSVTVTVTHTVDYLTPLIGQMLGGSIELSRAYTTEVLVEENANC